MRKSFFYLFLFFAMAWLVLPAFSGEARLLRQPTISKDHVAFVYANDIWVVSRAGGNIPPLCGCGQRMDS
jgi:tricorn protease